jgi:tRNA (cytidine32/uridine32-2'-O)-methyltransferase
VFSSLYLAQAVQVLAYVVRVASARVPAVGPGVGVGGDPAATVEQLEHFFSHLAQTLDDIDFHKGRSPRTIMKRLRRLFLRTDLEQREVRILRGILDDAQRMARIARSGEKAANRKS